MEIIVRAKLDKEGKPSSLTEEDFGEVKKVCKDALQGRYWSYWEQSKDQHFFAKGAALLKLIWSLSSHSATLTQAMGKVNPDLVIEIANTLRRRSFAVSVEVEV